MLVLNSKELWAPFWVFTPETEGELISCVELSISEKAQKCSVKVDYFAEQCIGATETSTFKYLKRLNKCSVKVDHFADQYQLSEEA